MTLNLRHFLGPKELGKISDPTSRQVPFPILAAIEPDQKNWLTPSTLFADGLGMKADNTSLIAIALVVLVRFLPPLFKKFLWYRKTIRITELINQREFDAYSKIVGCTKLSMDQFRLLSTGTDASKVMTSAITVSMLKVVSGLRKQPASSIERACWEALLAIKISFHKKEFGNHDLRFIEDTYTKVLCGLGNLDEKEALSKLADIFASGANVYNIDVPLKIRNAQ